MGWILGEGRTDCCPPALLSGMLPPASQSRSQGGTRVFLLLIQSTNLSYAVGISPQRSFIWLGCPAQPWPGCILPPRLWYPGEDAGFPKSLTNCAVSKGSLSRCWGPSAPCIAFSFFSLLYSFLKSCCKWATHMLISLLLDCGFSFSLCE